MLDVGNLGGDHRECFGKTSLLVYLGSRNDSAFLQRCNPTKSWRRKTFSRLFSLCLSTNSEFSISEYGFLHYYLLLYVFLRVAAISFHVHTKHVSSFLCFCQATGSLMTHAKKSSDPLRGVNKPLGAFLHLDAPPWDLKSGPSVLVYCDLSCWVVMVILDIKKLDIWIILVKSLNGEYILGLKWLFHFESWTPRCCEVCFSFVQNKSAWK